MAQLAFNNDRNLAGSVTESTIKQYLVSAALSEIDMVRYFIETVGLHPDTTFGGKPTTLCYAALKRDGPLLEYLHVWGADVNSCDLMGMRPIHYATLGGCLHCLAYLMHNKADVNRMNHSGKTALGLCEGKPHLVECRELLRRSGASKQFEPPRGRCFH